MGILLTFGFASGGGSTSWTKLRVQIAFVVFKCLRGKESLLLGSLVNGYRIIDGAHS